MQTLNSPLEFGVRALIVLTSAFPRPLDLNRLVLMDYCLLHSADLSGPPSVLPELPTRVGELGVKRAVLDHGIRLMVRAEMVDVVTTGDAIAYRAGEQAAPFLRLVTSPLIDSLTRVADWAVAEFADREDNEIRARMREVADRWTEEFVADAPGDGGLGL